LRAAGVPDGAIEIIPDEQDAIEAALRMGETGDLLLIFADTLVRSWKQITKFKPSGAAAPQPDWRSAAPAPSAAAALKGNGTSAGAKIGAPEAAEAITADFNFEGLIRDERGVHMAPESDD
jgi:cyanophycin synthetase